MKGPSSEPFRRATELGAPVGLSILCCVCFTYLFITSAWVVDDAYITFRTVDNHAHGYGLRWNVAERVQVYTHPLWMLLMSASYLVTHEVFFTSTALSLGLGLFVLVCCFRSLRPHAWWCFPLLSAWLFASKAYMDFSSSGLENPLSHALVAAFFTRFLWRRTEWAEASLREVAAMFALAALAFVTRQDTVLMYVPALCCLLALHLRRSGWRLLVAAACGCAPAFAWLAWSLWYYGFPYPNTAYAKALNIGVERAALARQGVVYLMNSLEWDPPTLLLMSLGTSLALASRRRIALAATAGLCAYLLYIVAVGASGSNMSGRFLSPPYLLAALITVHLLASRFSDRFTLMAVTGVVALLWVLAPASPLAVNGYPPLGRDGWDRSGVIDTRYFTTREGAALSQFLRTTQPPNHGWYRDGLRFRNSPERIQVGGANGGGAVGYFGFAAGPAKHVVDPLGLCDPLLARLPTNSREDWAPGHFPREIPDGYLASIERDQNLIDDPDLHRYYDELRLITRGPLWNWERLRAIVRMNLGRNDHWLRAYVERVGG